MLITVKNIYSVNDWSKTDNQALFYNIELIDDSIEHGKQIKFDYNKYGIDKKLHRTKTHRASPNAMEHWAMQYINYVEVTKPITLREKIKENLNKGLNKYNDL